MKQSDSRERILATLNRQPTDRTPVDIWCTPEVLDSLRRHTGKNDELEVYQSLGVDKIVWVFPDYSGISSDPNESGGGRTFWGVPTRTIQSGVATYHEFGASPLGDYDDPAQLDDYPLWPDPDRFDYTGARQLARNARELGFATIGPWISHFENYCHLRGLENAMMDVIVEPDFMNAALDRIDAIQTTMLERFLVELDESVDIVFISDDMGSQKSLLISLPAWDAFFRERLTRWCDLIHRHGKKVLFHTDGAARDLVPRLITSGIDILNPIQHICPGMDRTGLKRDFGGQVIFHGGVDNQHVLPFGSPEDVVIEVQTCLETLGQGGSGYICCSCHNIQAGTPLENILAMIETVHRS